MIINIIKAKICKVWDLNPRVLSTNDLKSLPLDRSGNLAIYFFNNINNKYVFLLTYINLLIFYNYILF